MAATPPSASGAEVIANASPGSQTLTTTSRRRGSRLAAARTAAFDSPEPSNATTTGRSSGVIAAGSSSHRPHVFLAERFDEAVRLLGRHVASEQIDVEAAQLRRDPVHNRPAA